MLRLDLRDLREPTVLGGGENRWRLVRGCLDNSVNCEHPGISDSNGVVNAFKTLDTKINKI